MVVNGVTSKGFEYSVDKKWIEDYRFIKALAKVQAGGSDVLQHAFAMMTMLLGDEQEEKLVSICQGEDGHVLFEDVLNQLTEIITALSENPETKN